MTRALRFALAAVICVAASADADEVYLSSGMLVKGFVVEEHGDRLVVSTVDGEQVVLRQEVDEVFFDDPERNYVSLGDEALAEGDLGAAEALFRRALQMNPGWPPAQAAWQRLNDQRRKVARGWRVSDPVHTLWTTWGMRLAETKTYPAVVAVLPQQVAGQAGVRRGDGLVAVWGASQGFRPIVEVAERLVGPPGTPVTITIQREMALRDDPTAHAPWPGVELSLTEEGLTVASVGILGAAAGLTPGDLVIALDGRATRYLPMAAARATVAAGRARGLRVTIQRRVQLTRPGDGGISGGTS